MLNILPLFEDELNFVRALLVEETVEEDFEEILTRRLDADQRILDLEYAVPSFLRCENCNNILNGNLPQIDGETFKLCLTCFKILRGVVQEIEDIFKSE